jgi:oxygen-dependent protoporphyrinogen oxidase
MDIDYDVIIIGSGLSGLSVAQFLGRKAPELSVLLLEKSDRPGGAVRSFHREGFLAEWGPHGFLDNCPESQELIESLGLGSRVQKAPLGQFARYLCKRGRLQELPQHPKKFLLSPILSPAAKLRILADLWIKPVQGDPSIGVWAAKRFGQAILPLVDAAVTGSFSGDYQRLSIDAVMPGVRELERQHGSVIRGLLHKKKIQSGKPKNGLPAMQSFPNGMEELTQNLARHKNIRLECTVDSIAREEGEWIVLADSERLTAKNLVVALPVNGALPLLAPLSPPPMDTIPVARLANVVLGYENADIPKAFGYLAPERENRFCMGVMFSSAMFPDRAPASMSLVEALVGGRRHPERLELDDEELAGRAHEDIRQLLHLPEAPQFVQVLRPASGIPQLETGHGRLLDWRGELKTRHPDLHITGFGWEGIGMNEMIKNAHRLTQVILEQQHGTPAPHEVRPVYF